MRRIAQHVRRWPRRVLITIVVIAVVLIAARIALPYIVERQVNRRLASIPGYAGAVDNVGIALLRGAYKLNGVAIFRMQGEVREPFFSVRQIDFSVAWRELMHGKVVSDIFLDQPKLTIVQAATPEESQKDVDRRWQSVVKDLFPIDITHLEIVDGEVRYIDRTKAPEVNVFIKEMQAVATGLRNRAGTDGKELPATINVVGETLGRGRIVVQVEADPLAAQPHFQLKAQVEDVDLTALNDSLKAIANVDVGRGTFQLAAEMAGKDGGFQGYVKPFFEDLDFNNLADQKKGVFTRVWENIVAGLAWLVKNKARDEVGTRIPFQGRFGDPQVGLWATVRNLFRHGFVRAFTPTVEGSVQARNVLPSGKSADGKDVARRGEGEPGGGEPGPDSPGAPTGRPKGERPRK